MAGHGPVSAADVVRKVTIVALLCAAVLLLHQLAVPGEGFDPRGLLALGFVVLAAHAIGDLSEVVRIPHITGYLLAGLLFGPSTAELLSAWAPQVERVAPLGDGILSSEVVQQLSLVDALALALIALTAGGELRIDDLRKTFGRSVFVLTGMMTAVVAGVVVYLGVLLEVFPGAIPGLAGLDRSVTLALALVLGTIASAASPAVVIAIINSTQSRGPVSTTTLIAVVFNQLAVAMLFTGTLSVALRAIGATGTMTVGQAATHIALSMGVGALVGIGIALYLRYVGAELLLFLVGVIFATTFVVQGLHGEPAIAFIAAGVAVRNLSDTGETLIRELERLSRPVYVVFFALAGAKLHLDALWLMLLPAIGLFLTRVGSVYGGVWLGARLARAPSTVERFGWTGLVSQAGLAIVLAGQMKAAVGGAVGEAMYSLALSVVALSEMLGPVLFQAGLGAAKEIGGGPPRPGTERPAAVREVGRPQDWPEPVSIEPWGERPSTGGAELDQALGALEIDLRALVREHVEEPVGERHRDVEQWLRTLRREWLRTLRRAITRAEELADDTAEDLREDIGQLASRWRDLTAEPAQRASLVDAAGPLRLLDRIDQRAIALPREIRAGVLASVVYAPRQEPAIVRFRRAWGRVVHRWFPLKRTVFLRDLGRYHLSGLLPARLEAVAAVAVRGELHALDAVGHLFEQIAGDFEEAARIAERGAGSDAVHAWLVGARTRLDPEFRKVATELGYVARGVVDEAAQGVGEQLQAIGRDAAVVATLDLPSARRRYNRVFADRNRGVQALGAGVRHGEALVAQRRDQLSLELELMGLEARVRAVVRRRGHDLGRQLRGRGPVQLALVAAHVNEWLEQASAAVDAPPPAGALSRQLRRDVEPLLHRIRDARTSVGQLVAELSDEEWVAELVGALIAHAMHLSEQYTVATAPTPAIEGGVPEPPPSTPLAFRDLVSAFVEARVARELLDLTEDLASRAREMAGALEEVERVVAFNVELSCAELDVLEDGARVGTETTDILRAMLIGAIGRSHHRLVRVAELAELTADQTEERVQHCVAAELAGLRRSILEGQVGELRAVWLRDVRFGQLARRAEAWGGWVPAVWGRTAGVARRALGEERISALRTTLGLPVAAAPAALPGFALPEPAGEVPVVYRRLFSDLPLESGDLLAGRSADLDLLRATLDRPGPLRAAALVGVDQQSASALAGAVVRGAFDGIVRYEARAPMTVEGVQGWLDEVQTGTGRAVVIDGLRWLFVRAPGGLGPVERLIEGMLADGGRNAWLLVADAAVWRFLAGATAIGELCGTVVDLGPLTEEELERAVLARHAMSGYDVVFEVEDDLGAQVRRLWLRDEERGKLRQEAWFRALHHASAGILQDALRLWLAAIVEVDDTRGLVRVGAVSRLPLAGLAALPEPVLLTLLEITRQGWTDAAQHARVFRTPLDEARAHLAGLCAAGVLVIDGEALRIAPHLRGAVHRVFSARGWT